MLRDVIAGDVDVTEGIVPCQSCASMSREFSAPGDRTAYMRHNGFSASSGTPVLPDPEGNAVFPIITLGVSLQVLSLIRHARVFCMSWIDENGGRVRADSPVAN